MIWFLPIFRLIAHKYTLSIYLNYSLIRKIVCWFDVVAVFFLFAVSLFFFPYYFLFIFISILLLILFPSICGSVSICLPFISRNNSQNSNNLLWINIYDSDYKFGALFSFLLFYFFSFSFAVCFRFSLAIQSHAPWITETHQISQIK